MLGLSFTCIRVMYVDEVIRAHIPILSCVPVPMSLIDLLSVNCRIEQQRLLFVHRSCILLHLSVLSFSHPSPYVVDWLPCTASSLRPMWISALQANDSAANWVNLDAGIVGVIWAHGNTSRSQASIYLISILGHAPLGSLILHLPQVMGQNSTASATLHLVILGQGQGHEKGTTLSTSAT